MVQKQKHFFEVGDKVQLKPDRILSWYKSIDEDAYATITRIQLCPDPKFFDYTEEEWRQGPHWVNFWVKLDDYPELDEHIQQMEVPYRYRHLQPLRPRITGQ